MLDGVVLEVGQAGEVPHDGGGVVAAAGQDEPSEENPPEPCGPHLFGVPVGEGTGDVAAFEVHRSEVPDVIWFSPRLSRGRSRPGRA